MARTRPLRTFRFNILDTDGEPIPGCVVTYNREDGYGWQIPGAFGDADSRDEAEVAALEALRLRAEAEIAQLAADAAAITPAFLDLSGANTASAPTPAQLAAQIAALSVDEQRETSLLLARHTAQQTGRRAMGVGFVVR
jgi:hypothetical protein